MVTRVRFVVHMNAEAVPRNRRLQQTAASAIEAACRYLLRDILDDVNVVIDTIDEDEFHVTVTLESAHAYLVDDVKQALSLNSINEQLSTRLARQVQYISMFETYIEAVVAQPPRTPPPPPLSPDSGVGGPLIAILTTVAVVMTAAVSVLGYLVCTFQRNASRPA